MEMISLGFISLVIVVAAFTFATTYMGWTLIYFCITTLKNQLLWFRTVTVSKMAIKMSNPNEKLMLTFGMGVVMAWVVIAATASYFSIVEQREISDSQLTVIGLLGGPALLIITSVLDLFKGKEGAKINILPDQLASEVESAEAERAHTRMLEQLKVSHDLELARMAKAHELNMEAYSVTGTNSVATAATPVVPKEKTTPKKPTKKSE